MTSSPPNGTDCLRRIPNRRLIIHKTKKRYSNRAADQDRAVRTRRSRVRCHLCVVALIGYRQCEQESVHKKGLRRMIDEAPIETCSQDKMLRRTASSSPYELMRAPSKGSRRRDNSCRLKIGSEMMPEICIPGWSSSLAYTVPIFRSASKESIYF